MPRISLAPQVNQQPVEKSYFTFVAGLNTDASPLNFPDNFSSAEENFVLNLDGSRQRRKGLALEEGGADVTLAEAETGVTRCHHWRNVNGDPTLNYVVMQNGKYLYFFTDNVALSAAGILGIVDMTLYAAPNATEAEIAQHEVNTDYGRGHLFVVGKYIEPLLIKWDADNTIFTVAEIVIQERVFEDLEDGVSLSTQPATLSSTHEYNLSNRGWYAGHITSYFADQGVYPAKNMIPSYGFFETVDESVPAAVEKNGIKTFSSDILVSELWQDVSAPKGHLIRDIYDTAVVVGGSGLSYAGTATRLSSYAAGASTFTIRVDTDHIITNGDNIALAGQLATYEYIVYVWPEPYDVIVNRSFDGTYTAIITGRSISAATNANPAVFTSTAHGMLTGDRVKLTAMTGGTWNTLDDSTHAITAFTIDTFTLGTVDGTSLGALSAGTATPTNTVSFNVTLGHDYNLYTDVTYGTVWTSYLSAAAAELEDYRPAAIAFYAGRVWYGGSQNPKISHKLFFSPIVETDSQYGKCYQVADPTSQHISDLLPTDGGVLVIPELDTVRELISYNGRLLVFADNGIWEISGGRNGIFTATGYDIRQISNIGCVSAGSVVVAEGVPFFWGDGAIYSIQTDPQEGFLFVQDMTTGRIQKFLNSLSKADKEHVQAAVDKNMKKIYWLYGTDASTTWKYPNWLVYDMRINAFSKFASKNTTTHDVRAIYDIEDYQAETTEYKNIKFICLSTDLTTLRVAELNDTAFEDFGTDAAAYLETGNDTLGDPSRRRYGRYLFTYFKRTETGWNLVDSDWVPDNPSGCYVRYIWNWADSSNTGKWSSQQSAYKETLYKYRRPWVPSTSTDLMGEAVVVNKSKIRGTGKVLRLRFDTIAEKDCHLYGWHLRQDINREA